MESDKSSHDRRIDELAAALYAAWSRNRQAYTGVVGPRWFALDHGIRDRWLSLATECIVADDHTP